MYAVFKEQYLSVLDHHFGDHSCCVGKEENGCCKYKTNEDLIQQSWQQH